MSSVFQDTLFGICVRFVSRGKWLAWEENHDEDLRMRYIYGDGKSEQDSSSGDELEKGADYKLIDFLENDPKVHCSRPRVLAEWIADMTIEPEKLVTWKEDIRDIRHLPLDVFNLHW